MRCKRCFGYIPKAL